MPLAELISTYGYAAIAIGTFLEGETVLILGGFAAHRGYLELPWVLLSAFLGTLTGDQFYFFVGRIKGRALLEKRPGWQARSEKVFSLLAKHEAWLILGFRFLYGLRTVTPFVVGASKISTIRFLSLNVCGALVWSIVIGVLGYLFGHSLEILIGDIKRYEFRLFLGIATLGLIVWITHLLTKSRPPAK